MLIWIDFPPLLNKNIASSKNHQENMPGNHKIINLMLSLNSFLLFKKYFSSISFYNKLVL